MKTIVGVYETHDKAVQAVTELRKEGFPADQISILGRADLVNNHIAVKAGDTAEKVEVGAGVVAGAALGVLTGVGIFAIPGLGFLYGAGALVGVLAGFDFGLIAGGFTAILTSIGVDEVNAIKYERHLNEGKFLVYMQGEGRDFQRAHRVLKTKNLHLELEVGIPKGAAATAEAS